MRDPFPVASSLSLGEAKPSQKSASPVRVSQDDVARYAAVVDRLAPSLSAEEIRQTVYVVGVPTGKWEFSYGVDVETYKAP